MRVQVPAGSPWWVYAAADAALTLHIGGGMAGLISGAVAAMAPKGGRWHRRAGKVFVASMLVMAGVGAVVAPLLPQRISIEAGIFTAYMVLSAWVTVRRGPARLGPLEFATIIAGVGSVAVAAWLIWIGSHSRLGTIDGQDYQPVFVFAAIGVLAVALDVRVLSHGGITGAPRVARHVWRICLAFFVASTSLFLGQPRIFPMWLLQSGLLFVPALAPLGLLVFWMVRVRFGKRWLAGFVRP